MKLIIVLGLKVPHQARLLQAPPKPKKVLIEPVCASQVGCYFEKSILLRLAMLIWSCINNHHYLISVSKQLRV